MANEVDGAWRNVHLSQILAAYGATACRVTGGTAGNTRPLAIHEFPYPTKLYDRMNATLTMHEIARIARREVCVISYLIRQAVTPLSSNAMNALFLGMTLISDLGLPILPKRRSDT